MKRSINKIFNNLSMFLIIITFSLGVVTLLILEQNSSYAKINNFINQKKIIDSLSSLDKNDIELALIQFNGKSNQLHHEIEKLRSLNKYDYTGQYILRNSDEYLANLDTLSQLTTDFNGAALEFYTEDVENKDEKDTNLENAFYASNQFLNELILRDIAYSEEKFNILELFAIFTLVITFLLTLWYRKRLKSIYRDIKYLYAIDQNKIEYEIFSQEMDAIKLRMNRKSVSTDNPAMLDPVTQINNYKGMLSAYGVKKGMKDSNFTSITIFDIDNFSKQKRTFNQEFTQAILKKVAFTLTLHEQATDVIARTDYNQFTVILSRASKEQSFKDIDIIRQSISEIKFRIPGNGPLTITISGGFIIKPNNQHLEESLRQAKELLVQAKKRGKNLILQVKDTVEHEL